MARIQLTGALRRLIPLAFALVMGVVAVTLVRRYVGREREQLARERAQMEAQMRAEYREPIEVLIAAKDVPEGTVLDASYLASGKVPEEYMQPYATRDAGQVLGLVTATPIAEGEQILLNKLRRPDTAPKDATLSAMMPRGKRAVTIGVDVITGVGGFVRPGDTVDILWTIQVPGQNKQQGEVVTVTLFQGVPVLAVGGEMAAARSKSKQEASPEYTVTLALTPQETSFLLFAREQGRVQLSLRSRSESGTVALAPANITTLMETIMGVPAGPSATKPPREVEVYKGLKRDVVQLPPEPE